MLCFSEISVNTSCHTVLRPIPIDSIHNHNHDSLRLTFSKLSFNFAGIFRSCSFFMAANVRKAVAEGRSDCIPIFLSEIPLLFHRKIVKPDVAFVQVSMMAYVRKCCVFKVIKVRHNFTRNIRPSCDANATTL